MADVADAASKEAREAFTGIRGVWMRMGDAPSRRRSITHHALLCFVPLAGPVFVMGRQLLWARSAAWRIEKPLPQVAGGDAGGLVRATALEALRIGFIGAATLFAWMLAAAIVQALLGLLPGGAGMAGGAIGAVVVVIALAVASVAALRAAVYSSIKPGFQAGTACAMAAHAPLRLIRVAVFEVLAIVLMTVAASGLLVPLVSEAADAMDLLPVLALGMGRPTARIWILPLVALAIIGIAFAAMYGIVLLGFMAAGLLGDWMAEFDVASWGPSAQPLPFMRGARPTSEPDAPVAPEPDVASEDAAAFDD